MTTRKPRSRKPIGSSLRAAEKKQSSKYNAKGEHIDGNWFASAAEAIRYRQLKAMEEAGQIERLDLQPAFPVVINNRQLFIYRADFQYTVVDEQGSPLASVVEDVKGHITDIYRLKKKVVEAQYSIELAEIPVGGKKGVPKNNIALNWDAMLPKKKPHEKAFKPTPYDEF